MAKKAGRSASQEELRELELLLTQFPEYGFLAEVLHSILSAIFRGKNW